MSVVVAELCEENRLSIDLIDEPGLVGYTPGPIAGQAMLKRFGFSNSLEWRTFYVLDKCVDPLEDFSVGSLPIEIVLPGMLGEDELHSASSCSVPPPASSSATDSSNLRAFFGLRRRYAVSSRAS